MRTTALKPRVPAKRPYGPPAGFLETLVGVAILVQREELERAVVQRLVLDCTDRVLQVGSGPGTVLRMAASRAGFVAGLDPSREMVEQATRTNRDDVLAGRVEVLRASPSAIPYPNDSFTVVFAADDSQRWDGSESGLREIVRVLRSGGRLLIALRAWSDEDLDTEIQHVSVVLAKCGFDQVRVEKHTAGEGGAFVTARRP